MHLNPDSLLFGQPAQLVRDFLREAIGMRVFETEVLREWLEVSPDDAPVIVTEMLTDGYIVQEYLRDSVQWYSLTVKGTQLAMVSMSQPISRELAEQLLANLLVRAADSAWQRPFVLQVTKVALFGDLLGEDDMISDVDLAVEVASPYEGKAYTEPQRRRFEYA